MRSANLLPAGSHLAGPWSRQVGRIDWGGRKSAVPKAAQGGGVEVMERHVQGCVQGLVLSLSCSRSISILLGVCSLPHTPTGLPNYRVKEARWAPVCVTVREDEFAVSQRQRSGKDAGERE